MACPITPPRSPPLPILARPPPLSDSRSSPPTSSCRTSVASGLSLSTVLSTPSNSTTSHHTPSRAARPPPSAYSRRNSSQLPALFFDSSSEDTRLELLNTLRADADWEVVTRDKAVSEPNHQKHKGSSKPSWRPSKTLAGMMADPIRPTPPQKKSGGFMRRLTQSRRDEQPPQPSRSSEAPPQIPQMPMFDPGTHSAGSGSFMSGYNAPLPAPPPPTKQTSINTPLPQLPPGAAPAASGAPPWQQQQPAPSTFAVSSRPDRGSSKPVPVPAPMPNGSRFPNGAVPKPLPNGPPTSPPMSPTEGLGMPMPNGAPSGVHMPQPFARNNSTPNFDQRGFANTPPPAPQHMPAPQSQSPPRFDQAPGRSPPIPALASPPLSDSRWLPSDPRGGFPSQVYSRPPLLSVDGNGPMPPQRNGPAGASKPLPAPQWAQAGRGQPLPQSPARPLPPSQPQQAQPQQQEQPQHERQSSAGHTQLGQFKPMPPMQSPPPGNHPLPSLPNGAMSPTNFAPHPYSPTARGFAGGPPSPFPEPRMFSPTGPPNGAAGGFPSPGPSGPAQGGPFSPTGPPAEPNFARSGPPGPPSATHSRAPSDTPAPNSGFAPSPARPGMGRPLPGPPGAQSQQPFSPNGPLPNLPPGSFAPGPGQRRTSNPQRFAPQQQAPQGQQQQQFQQPPPFQPQRAAPPPPGAMPNEPQTVQRPARTTSVRHPNGPGVRGTPGGGASPAPAMPPPPPYSNGPIPTASGATMHIIASSEHRGAPPAPAPGANARPRIAIPVPSTQATSPPPAPQPYTAPVMAAATAATTPVDMRPQVYEKRMPQAQPHSQVQPERTRPQPQPQSQSHQVQSEQPRAQQPTKQSDTHLQAEQPLPVDIHFGSPEIPTLTDPRNSDSSDSPGSARRPVDPYAHYAPSAAQRAPQNYSSVGIGQPSTVVPGSALPPRTKSATTAARRVASSPLASPVFATGQSIARGIDSTHQSAPPVASSHHSSPHGKRSSSGTSSKPRVDKRVSVMNRPRAKKKNEKTFTFLLSHPRVVHSLLPNLTINSFLNVLGSDDEVRKYISGEMVGRWVMREWGITIDRERGRSWPGLTVWEGFLESLLHDPAVYSTYPDRYFNLLRHLSLSHSLIVLFLRTLPASAFPYAPPLPFEDDLQLPPLHKSSSVGSFGSLGGGPRRPGSRPGSRAASQAGSDAGSIIGGGLGKMPRRERVTELVMPAPLSAGPQDAPKLPNGSSKLTKGKRRGSIGSLATVSGASLGFGRRRSNSTTSIAASAFAAPASSSVPASPMLQGKAGLPPVSFPAAKRYQFARFGSGGTSKESPSHTSWSRPGSIMSVQSSAVGHGGSAIGTHGSIARGLNSADTLPVPPPIGGGRRGARSSMGSNASYRSERGGSSSPVPRRWDSPSSGVRNNEIEPAFDRPPPYMTGRAPILRVFVPLSEKVQRWPSAEGAAHSWRELEKCGASKRMRLGDLVVNTALARPVNTEHVLIFVPFVQHKLVPLEYVHCATGHLPHYLDAFALSPVYYDPFLPTPQIVYLDFAPYAQVAMRSLRLAYDWHEVTTVSGARLSSKRYLHVAGLEIKQGDRVAPEWIGMISLEAEGTAEGKNDMLARFGGGDPSRAVMGAWEIVRERSMMGSLWLRLVREP